jgi:hypothetical protein
MTESRRKPDDGKGSSRYGGERVPQPDTNPAIGVVSAHFWLPEAAVQVEGITVKKIMNDLCFGAVSLSWLVLCVGLWDKK